MKSAATLPRWLTVTSAICCVLGILISIYAYHVETAHEKDATFRALCDISKGISCTKVFSSRYLRNKFHFSDIHQSRAGKSTQISEVWVR